MALAPLLYNITFDNQTRILYFWNKAGHELYHCEIPSPAPALPTVSMVISYIRQDKSRYYTTGGTYYLYDDSGNPIPWDSINSYQFFGTYESASSTTIDSGEFYQRYQSIIDSGGVVNYKNTGLGLYVQRVVFYSCASTDATVITVYDSSNTPYNAFKYTSDGTDYYYVLDGVQTEWTDDLDSIGYKLPTIGYVSSIKTQISMNEGDLQTLYDENGKKMTVSTYGISYPAVRVYSSSSDTTGIAVVNKNWTVHGPQFSNGDLSVSNLTGSRQTIQRIAFIK